MFRAIRTAGAPRSRGPCQRRPGNDIAAAGGTSIDDNDRPTYHPAKLELGDAGCSVRPLPWAGAPDLRGLRPADALLVLPPGDTRLDLGQLVNVVLL